MYYLKLKKIGFLTRCTVIHKKKKFKKKLLSRKQSVSPVTFIDVYQLNKNENTVDPWATWELGVPTRWAVETPSVN